MEYDPKHYLDNDPELKQLLEDYASGNLDTQRRAQKHQAKLQNQKIDFQLNLVKARDIRKVTQAELAQRLGISQPAISKIENGNPSLEKIIQVMDALGCRLTISDIMNKIRQDT